jgi:hypothetical protein
MKLKRVARSVRERLQRGVSLSILLLLILASAASGISAGVLYAYRNPMFIVERCEIALPPYLIPQSS